VVEEAGWSGEQTYSMVARLDECLQSAASSSKHYSLVILLGGTNDVCYCVPPSHCIAQLRALHSLAHAHSPQTLSIGMTVPEIAPCAPVLAGAAQHEPPKRELDLVVELINEAIIAEFPEVSMVGKDADGMPMPRSPVVAALPPATVAAFDRTRFSALDLHARMAQWLPAPPPLAPSTPYRHDQQHHWDVDRVHLSAKGYDHVGRMLAEFICENKLLQPVPLKQSQLVQQSDAAAASSGSAAAASNGPIASQAPSSAF
jgi:hypothetical protein